MIKTLNYKVTYDFVKNDDTQTFLDKTYKYGKDISTRVFHRKRINLIYETISRLKKRNQIISYSTALDIGCNAGLYSKMLSEFGFSKVLGVDISKIHIQDAKNNFEFKNEENELLFNEVDATSLNLKSRYDFILCTEVIEHTDKPINVVESIYNLLNDDGIAIISLPNRISLNYIIPIIGKKILNKPFSPDFKSHINYPFYKSYRIFKESGFKIVKTTGTNLFLIDFLLPFLIKFPIIIKIDSYLSKQFPFKYFSQFFFLIIKKNVKL